MLINVNIKLWDHTTLEKMEEVGLTTKFLETMYYMAFENLVTAICEEAGDMLHSISIEAVDNTAE